MSCTAFSGLINSSKYDIYIECLRVSSTTSLLLYRPFTLQLIKSSSCLLINSLLHNFILLLVLLALYLVPMNSNRWRYKDDKQNFINVIVIALFYIHYDFFSLSVNYFLNSGHEKRYATMFFNKFMDNQF